MATSGGILALLAIPNLEVAARDPSYRYGLETFGPLGANFFRTDPGILIWRPLLGVAEDQPLKGGMFPGAIAIVLGVWGALDGWRRSARSRAVAIAGLVLVAVGGAMAIGTAATGLRRFAPYRLLYEIGPPFNALRATARAWMIGLCGLGLLAGLGAMALARW